MDRERPEMYEALGRTIQVLRTDQGLERKDLAARAGISYSYLAAIENGKKPPSSNVLFAIAAALGLRSHELLASTETRIERGVNLSARSQIERPSMRHQWFHQESAAGDTDQIPESTAITSMPPPQPAGYAAEDRSDMPLNRNIPRSPAGFLMELERLTAGLDDDDRELVLDLARRLGARRE